MKPVQIFNVVPSLPEPLMRLKELSYNLWWSWNPEAHELFSQLDSVEWERCYHNPVKMLGAISQDRLQIRAQDEGFLAQLDRVWAVFQEYLQHQHTWFSKKYEPSEKPIIAYFSAEFGITESLPIYSGGLGMLAGDHLKSASDLGIPLVGVGLLYRVGYFKQYLNADGWQQELYPVNDFYNMPIQLVRNQDGNPVTVEVRLPERVVQIQIWKAQIGRNVLILLDTDTTINQPNDQRITGMLYGGDNETRIQQEIVLGIGGLQALHAMNFHPPVYHMNEGHSAFLAIERIRIAMERHGLTFHEGLELTRSSNIFTTHTPVPAGIDVFSRDYMERYFLAYSRKLGITWEEFLNLGWQIGTPKGDGFSMAVCAISLSSYVNGVSKLHSLVSREMWKNLYPGFGVDEVPIEAITNGVHSRSHISSEMSQLYHRYLGPRWAQGTGDHSVWDRIQQIPAEELWRTHERRRERLVAFARNRLQAQLAARGAPPSELEAARECLNPETLTIVFARRFATYKRATLLFRDYERLVRILSNKDRPLQFIFAGKAHPKDEPGKKFIREIIQHLRDERIRRHVVFIEDYDMLVARYLVQGSDVWMNTPRRPHEASGTSGMKASANGSINLSILDGWWAEAWNPRTGWAIGRDETYSDLNYQDEVEANALYKLLENDVAPLFYNRTSDGLPRGWVDLMKSSMMSICPMFNTDRMVGEYNDRFYMPSYTRYRVLSENDRKHAKELAKWRALVQTSWPSIHIEGIDIEGAKDHRVGEKVRVNVQLCISDLAPHDLKVQAYLGAVDSDDRIQNGVIYDLQFTNQVKGHAIFGGELQLNNSGRIGVSIRVVPSHPDLSSPIITRLILWA